MATGIPKSKINGHEAKQPRCAVGGGFRLEYEEKRSVSEIIETCPRANLSLVKAPVVSHEWTNRLYFGDNLGILGTLLDDPAVRGKVSLIYIDPPYSTN